jgi:hypothetical protein
LFRRGRGFFLDHVFFFLSLSLLFSHTAARSHAAVARHTLAIGDRGALSPRCSTDKLLSVIHDTSAHRSGRGHATTSSMHRCEQSTEISNKSSQETKLVLFVFLPHRSPPVVTQTSAVLGLDAHRHRQKLQVRNASLAQLALVRQSVGSALVSPRQAAWRASL